MSDDFIELKGHLFDADLAIKKAMHFTHILDVHQYHDLAVLANTLADITREIKKDNAT